MEKFMSFLGKAGSTVATIFGGGTVGDMIKTGATTMIKNRMAGGGSDQPSLN
jgi:hypothetical protein